MNHIGTISIETDRLILRQFTTADAEAMYRNWTSDNEVTRYLTWSTHKNVEMSLEYINFCIKGYENPAFYQWGIEIKNTQELIGNISVISGVRVTQKVTAV